LIPPREIFDADGLIHELQTQRLAGHGRALAIDRALGNFDEATLLRLAPTLFGDGSVSSLVAERYSTHPGMALEVSRSFLEQGDRRYTMKGWSAPARVARYTAVQILGRLASPEARQILKSLHGATAKDPAMLSYIRLAERPGSMDAIPEEILDKLNAGTWETRAEALGRIVDRGLLAALPHLRRIAATDPSIQVRYRAWYAQAALLDVDAVPLWMAALKDRAQNEDAAREALHALAHIGDNRSIAPLLDAFEEGYKPTLVAEAMRAFGPAIVPPLMDRLEARPELLERKVTIDVGAGVELSAVQDLLHQRLTGSSAEKFVADALACLKFFGKNPPVQKAVVTIVQDRLGGSGITAPGDLKRALSRAQSKST
jgi:HEAT repeat protein